MKKLSYISLANVLSMISVVYMHVDMKFFEYSEKTWWIHSFVIASVFLFAVPVFFMITGATLMDYMDRYDSKKFFMKRINKTVIPFFAWSIIALIVEIIRGTVNASDLSLLYVWNGIWHHSFNAVYWFFPAIFVLYLCLPCFASIPKDKRKRLFTYLAVFSFFGNMLIPFLNNYFSLGIAWTISLPPVSGYLIYLIVGYLLSEYEISKKWEIVIYVSAIIGLIVMMAGTYHMCVQNGITDQSFRNYADFPVFLYAIGVFTFIKQHGVRIMNTWIGKIVEFLDQYTFGVYLIHIYVITAVYKLFFEMLFGLSRYTLIYQLAAPIFVIPISVGIIWIMRKIPVVRRIVP